MAKTNLEARLENPETVYSDNEAKLIVALAKRLTDANPGAFEDELNNNENHGEFI